MSQSRIFYQNGRVTTVTEDQKRRSILQGHQISLAEKQTANAEHCNFLATDIKGSVFSVKGQFSDETHQYSAYGGACSIPSSASLLGYNGERPERSGLYLLGSERAYSASLMRFHSVDVLSPFGEGGMNAYAYCKNDPVNYTDPTGQMRKSVIPPLVVNKENVKRLRTQKAEMKGIVRSEKELLASNSKEIESNRTKWHRYNQDLEKDKSLTRKERMHATTRAKIEKQQSEMEVRNAELTAQNNEISRFLEKDEASLLRDRMDLREAKRILGRTIYDAWKAEATASNIRK